MNKEEIVDYVMRSPQNTNKSILTQMVSNLEEQPIDPKRIKDMYYDNSEIFEINEVCNIGSHVSGNKVLKEIFGGNYDIEGLVVTVGDQSSKVERLYGTTIVRLVTPINGHENFYLDVEEEGYYLFDNTVPDGNITGTATITGYCKKIDLKKIDTKYIDPVFVVDLTNTPLDGNKVKEALLAGKIVYLYQYNEYELVVGFRITQGSFSKKLLLNYVTQTPPYFYTLDLDID